jgi:hypothetical protein
MTSMARTIVVCKYTQNNINLLTNCITLKTKHYTLAPNKNPSTIILAKET